MFHLLPLLREQSLETRKRASESAADLPGHIKFLFKFNRRRKKMGERELQSSHLLRRKLFFRVYEKRIDAARKSREKGTCVASTRRILFQLSALKAFWQSSYALEKVYGRLRTLIARIAV